MLQVVTIADATRREQRTPPTVPMSAATPSATASAPPSSAATPATSPTTPAASIAASAPSAATQSNLAPKKNPPRASRTRKIVESSDSSDEDRIEPAPGSVSRRGGATERGRATARGCATAAAEDLEDDHPEENDDEEGEHEDSRTRLHPSNRPWPRIPRVQQNPPEPTPPGSAADQAALGATRTETAGSGADADRDATQTGVQQTGGTPAGSSAVHASFRTELMRRDTGAPAEEAGLRTNEEARRIPVWTKPRVVRRSPTARLPGRMQMGRPQARPVRALNPATLSGVHQWVVTQCRTRRTPTLSTTQTTIAST